MIKKCNFVLTTRYISCIIIPVNEIMFRNQRNKERTFFMSRNDGKSLSFDNSFVNCLQIY